MYEGEVAQNHILSIILLLTPALSGHEILTATKRKITKKIFPVDKRKKPVLKMAKNIANTSTVI